MKFYMKKYHLQYTLPDGNIWRGFINVDSNRKEDLPDIIKGSFWVSKDEKGWHGERILDEPEKYRENDLGVKHVIITGVYHPERDYTSAPTSVQEASERFRYISNIMEEYDSIERFEARIEDCQRIDDMGNYICETHEFEHREKNNYER